MTLTQAIEQFTTYLRANHRSPLTIDVYRRDLESLGRFADDPAVVDITPDLVHRFVVSDAVQIKSDGQPRSEVTINRAKAALRSFGAWILATGISDRNPAAALEIHRVDRKSPTALADGERKKLVRELGARKGEAAARDRVMLDLLLGTGVRLAELVGLDIGDVDLDNKRIAIHAKGGNDETRFLSAGLRRLLRRYLRHRNQDASDSPALFLSNRGTRISHRQVQARFRQWLAWAGIDRPGLTVHSTRHTFASRLYHRTRDLVLVGKALGHMTTEATAIYVHQDDDALEEALESL